MPYPAVGAAVPDGRVMKPVLATIVLLVAVASVPFPYGAVLSVGLTLVGSTLEDSAADWTSLGLGLAV
jgi:hypothetical protein